VDVGHGGGLSGGRLQGVDAVGVEQAVGEALGHLGALGAALTVGVKVAHGEEHPLHRGAGHVGSGWAVACGVGDLHGAFPTSYIPTTGAAATREQDVAYIATAGWLNTTVGTMLLDFNQMVPPSQQDTSAIYFGAYPTTSLTNGEDMGFTLYTANNFLTRNPVMTAPSLGGAAGLSRIALALDGTGKYGVRK